MSLLPQVFHRGSSNSVRVWTLAVVVLSVAICSAITVLHFRQETTLRDARRMLGTFREARVDLTKAFVHLTLAGDARSPFRPEAGIALLDQAIATLKETEFQLTSESSGQTSFANLGRDFQTKTAVFRDQLLAYGNAKPEDKDELALPLHLVFHELEDLAQRVDSMSQRQVNALTDRLHNQFQITLLASTLLLAAVCLGVDLLGRKQQRAEAAVRQSEQQYRLLADQTDDFISLHDLKENRLYVSPSFYRRTGWTPEEVQASDWRTRQHPEDVARVEMALEENLAGRTNTIEHRVRRRDGSWIWLERHGKPIWAPDGKVAQVLLHARDITERKNAEEAIRQSEARYRTLVDHLPVGLFLADTTGHILMANPAAVRLSGLANANEAIGRHVFEFQVPEERPRAAEIFQAALQRHGFPPFEGTILRADGTRLCAELSGAVVRDAFGAAVGFMAMAQDITERRNAAAALHERLELQDQLEKVVATVPGVIFSFQLNPDGRMTVPFCTNRMVELWGFRAEDLREDFSPAFARIHPEDAERVRMTIAESARTVTPWLDAFRIRHPEKGELWIEGHSVPRREPDGRILWHGFVQDVTARKKSEESVRQSGERLNFALEASHTGAWSLNLDDGTATRTLIHARIFGYPTAEGAWSSAVFFEHVLAEDRERVRQCVQEGIAANSAWSFECRIQRVDGRVRWVFVAGGPEQGGFARQVYGIIQDITSRKEVEEALRESERNAQRRAEELQTLMDLAPLAIWVASDPECRCITGNRTANALYEAGQDENVSAGTVSGQEPKTERRFFQQGRELSSHELPMQQAILKNIEVRASELTVVSPSGRTFTMLGNASPLRDDSGQVRGCIGCFLDITELKKLEQERAEIEAQMRQQQKLESIGTLASGVAHEINNPINGIMNYAQLLQDRLPGGSPLTEFTGEILHETQRVATIVRNLLTFARYDQQSHSPARIADIVEAVISLVRAVLRRDQITLTIKIDDGLPALKCRSQQIQQVLMNLITNARDALNERYPEHHPDKVLMLHAQLLEKAGRRWIRVTVEDHGSGIPPDVRDRIFDPFFTTKGRNQGTGLGLSISHGIVKEHHGEWTVDSEPGHFTRMQVDLPVDNGWKI